MSLGSNVIIKSITFLIIHCDNFHMLFIVFALIDYIHLVKNISLCLYATILFNADYQN